MWAAIFGLSALFAVVAVVFLWSRFCKFGIIGKISGGKKWLRRLLGLIPMVVFGIFCYINVINTVIVMLHMALYWMIAEFVFFIIRKLRKKNPEISEKKFRPYRVGIIVLCFELIYFSAGWYMDYHMWEKDYSLTTEKDIGEGSLRIAQITDSHTGATFDGEGFSSRLETVQKTSPDVLVITGDFVDDDTDKDDMVRCCRALGEFKCPYGVYFIFGNHDKGYSNYRNFTSDDLREELAKNNVIILEDEYVLIDDRFYIVGRQDRSVPDRADIAGIMEGLDPSKYCIILDHQPNDYDAEAETGADLVLSGHTHGGQLFEIKYLGQLMGANDRTYGIEKRDNTTFIVSSGMSDWAIKFKTGTKSEFCIIDVAGK